MALVLLVAAPLAGLLLLALRGFVDGDAPSDAVFSVSLIARQGPDAVAWYAEIVAVNRSSRTTVVLARARPISGVAAQWAADYRATALLHRPDLADADLLGAVEPGSTRAWLLPLPPSTSRAFRVSIAAEQNRHRTRRLTFTRSVKPGTRAQVSSPLGVRADPNDRR